MCVCVIITCSQYARNNVNGINAGQYFTTNEHLCEKRATTTTRPKQYRELIPCTGVFILWLGDPRSSRMCPVVPSYPPLSADRCRLHDAVFRQSVPHRIALEVRDLVKKATSQSSRNRWLIAADCMTFRGVQTLVYVEEPLRQCSNVMFSAFHLIAAICTCSFSFGYAPIAAICTWSTNSV